MLHRRNVVAPTKAQGVLMVNSVGIAVPQASVPYSNLHSGETCMSYTIVVTFSEQSEFEFKLGDDDIKALPREEASRWLHQEFQALECEPRSMVGKILLLDVIVDVARYGGEQRFAENGAWALQFARCCAATLKRDAIRIDVPNMVIH